MICCSALALLQTGKRPVLQITIDGWGDVWPQGKHNYLTVWPDGTVTYLHRAKRGLTAEITDGISKSKIEELDSISGEAAKTKSGQSASAAPLDYRMSVHIEMLNGSVIEIAHYDFDHPDAVNHSVYRLLCFADSIRDEPYRLTKPANCDERPR
jgi:hypothetical protein